MIYLDMDGVVADFEGMLEQHGHPRGTEWDDDTLWATVRAIPNFWTHMPLMPDAKILWNAVKDLNPTFLTAPSRSDPRCKPGKLAFVAKHFGDVPVIFSRARDKWQHANPGDILVDDTVKNIKDWRAHGGIGIWHKNAASTIAKIKAALQNPNADLDAIPVGASVIVRAFKEDMAPQVILLMGLPAAGKSTFVKNELVKYYNHRMPHVGAFQVLNSDNQLKKHQWLQAVDDYKTLSNVAGDAAQYNQVADSFSYLSNDGVQVKFNLPFDEFAKINSFDQFFKRMYKPYYASYFGGRAAAKRDSDALTDRKIAAGDVTILDSTGTNPSKWLPLFAKAKAAGHTTSVVWLDLPVEYSIARDQYRGDTEGRSVGQKIIRDYVPELPVAYKAYVQSDLVDRVMHFKWHGEIVKGKYVLISDHKKYPKRQEQQ